MTLRPNAQPFSRLRSSVIAGLAFSGAALMSAAPAAQAAPSYTLTDLGVLPGYSYSSGNKINNFGNVAGTSYGPSGSHGFFYNGSLHDVGTFGGNSSEALGINNLNQVVGFAAKPDNYSEAFMYDGSLHDLGRGAAFGINDQGHVVGADANSGWYYDGSVRHTIGTLGGSVSAGVNVNSSDLVAGYATTASGDFHAISYHNGVLTDLGTLGGTSSSGHDVNDSGIIVGTSTIGAGSHHAFIDNNGVMTDINGGGFQESYGYGINSAGDVVGSGYNAVHGYDSAFFYHDGVMYDLRNVGGIDPTWKLEFAADINDRGQIVGEGFHNGQYHGYLLTPTPEPSSVAAMMIGFVSLFGCIGLRRRSAKNAQ
ncbi:MAG: PEP-CTERM sorting domain-containing protein [Capsulimonas sp.]|uniref:PEP-CTERM sorting domain-containing protein n=1 Tax=Capsulimonas sp. TaxID=2494211 RepID=UPI0032661B07